MKAAWPLAPRRGFITALRSIELAGERQADAAQVHVPKFVMSRQSQLTPWSALWSKSEAKQEYQQQVPPWIAFAALRLRPNWAFPLVSSSRRSSSCETC